jgi:hypothetical protein
LPAQIGAPRSLRRCRLLGAHSPALPSRLAPCRSAGCRSVSRGSEWLMRLHSFGVSLCWKNVTTASCKRRSTYSTAPIPRIGFVLRPKPDIYSESHECRRGPSTPTPVASASDGIGAWAPYPAPPVWFRRDHTPARKPVALPCQSQFPGPVRYTGPLRERRPPS